MIFERRTGANKSRFPFRLAHRLEPTNKTGSHFQPVGRQLLQILDDAIELRSGGPVLTAGRFRRDRRQTAVTGRVVLTAVWAQSSQPQCLRC